MRAPSNRYRLLAISVNCRSQSIFMATGRREGIHVEEIDAVGNPVLDDHALSVATDEFCRGPCALVGEQQGRLLVSEIGHRQLAQRALIAVSSIVSSRNLWGPIGAGDTGQLNAPPSRERHLADRLKHLLGAPS